MAQYKFTATFSKIDDYVALGVSDTQNKNGFINDNYVLYQNNSWYNVGGVDCNKREVGSKKVRK